MTLLTRKKQFAIATEGTEGTAETLTASDVPFELEELEATYENQMNERNPIRSTLSPVPMLPGIGQGTITGRVELVGGGDATTAPPVDLILQACGLKKYTVYSAETSGDSGTFVLGEQITDGGSKEGRLVHRPNGQVYYLERSGSSFIQTDTITGTTSGASAQISTSPAAAGFAYMPDSTETLDSYTAAVMEDGLKKEIYGARGTCSFEIEGAGRLAYLRYTLSGAAAKPSDQALFTGLTLPSVVPEAFLSADVAAGSDSVCVNSMTVDLQNNVAPRLCANQADGIVSFRITERTPTITIDPEAELEATIDFWTKYDAATEFAFRATVGSSEFLRSRVIAPSATYTELSNGDRDGIMTYDATLQLNNDLDDGDDELIVAFF